MRYALIGRQVLCWLLGLGLLGSTPAWAGFCDSRAHEAHRLAVLGAELPASVLPAECLGTIDTPPRGSGNWPVMLRGARYIAGQTDGQDLLPWLQGGGVWSHNGRENGSTMYESWNTATALAVLHLARQRGHGKLERAAARWLRALWAKYALAATPWQPARTRFWQHKERHERRRLRYLGYVGPMIHMAGNRQAEDPKRGENTGAWVDVHGGNPVLAWAADWPGRRYKQQFIEPGSRGGTLWTVQTLTGKTFGETVDPASFGLSEQERKTLRAFLSTPTDETLARRVGAWLDGYPYWPRLTLSIRRYGSGAVVTVMSSTYNASKSGAVVVAADRQSSTWLLPSAYKGVGAVQAWGEIVGNTAIATSKDGGRWQLDLSGFGALAWQARWTDQGLHFGAGGAPR